tara:strand:+ start:254 stop:391 length:138 start_codon:yes stop_codon:yes gene_type:complete
MTEVLYECPNCGRQGMGEHDLVMRECRRCCELMEVKDGQKTKENI